MRKFILVVRVKKEKPNRKNGPEFKASFKIQIYPSAKEGSCPTSLRLSAVTIRTLTPPPKSLFPNLWPSLVHTYTYL